MFCFTLKSCGFIVIVPLGLFKIFLLYGISAKDSMRTLRSSDEAFHLKGLENHRIVELDEGNGV